MKRENVKFLSEGLQCAGWLYMPQNASEECKVPAIVMAHGFSLVKEAFLDRYAEVFCKGGFAVLVFDYRNFGESESYLPQHLEPNEQIKDYRNAISWICTLPEIDVEKIGVWGTSYSGGHVLHIGAVDKRVKAVVAQVPTINGRKGAQRKMVSEKFNDFMRNLTNYRTERYVNGERKMYPVVSLNGIAAQPHPDAYKWFTETAEKVAPTWKNEITLESMEHYVEYNPAGLIDFISPTPLMIIAAMEDGITPPDLIIEAFEEQAKEPKKLLELPGGHFDVYNGPTFDQASQESLKWFQQYLLTKKTSTTNK